MLRYLANDHETLRIPATATNSSRWPLGSTFNLKADLNNLGVHRVVSQPAAIEERLERIAISMMGYMKRIAAVRSIQINRENLDLDDALTFLRTRLNRHYELLAWQDDADERIKETRF